jgi:hypothetical protein
LRPPRLLERHSEIGDRRRVRRRQAYRLTDAGERFLAASERGENCPSDSIPTRRIWVERQCPIAAAQRIFLAANLVQGSREIERPGRAIGLELQGPGKVACSSVRTAELRQRHSQSLQDVGVIRVGTQQLLVSPDRLAQPPGPVVADRSFEPLAAVLITR